MKVSDKLKQYSIVILLTCVALALYLACYAKGMSQPISIDMDKPMDSFMKGLIDHNGDVPGGIVRACEYNMQNLIILGMGSICGDIWIGINSYYIFSFFMISVSMYWYLQKLHVSVPVACGISVLAAFLPFHINRGEGQILTANFFLVPLFMGMLYELIYEKKTDKYRNGYIMLMCISPFMDIRISLMMLILFAVLIIHRHDLKITKHLLGYLCPLVIFVVLEGLLTSTFGSEGVESSLQTAQEEGLRILDMLMPLRYHVVDRLSNLRFEYDVAFAANGESGLNTMGILISIGFVWGMLRFFFGQEGDKRIVWINWISILVIIIANIHGLNLLFEYFGLHLAYWNRMGIFILVGSASILGITADEIKGVMQNRIGTWGAPLSYAVLLVAGIMAFLELLLRQNMGM